MRTRTINNLGIMISVTAIFATRAGIAIPEIIPTKLTRYTIRCTRIIIIRCGADLKKQLLELENAFGNKRKTKRYRD